MAFGHFCTKIRYNQNAADKCVMLALLLGINFLKNFGFSVVGNPALSTSSNSYVGAFFPGAFVGRSG
jgi:hypothetical protein